MQKWDGGGRTVDYKHLAETYFKLLGKKKMRDLEQFVSARASDLYGAVKRYEADPAEGGCGGRDLEVGSDDGFSDLRYHIVGMGKDEFDACMGDPEKMEIRSRKGEYTESFHYVFQEPEPPRTKAQKDKAVADLLTAAEDFENLVQEIDGKLSNLRMKAMRLNLLVNTVKNDRKKSA